MKTDARGALARLAASWRVPLNDASTTALLGFAELLLAWNARINLTGAKTVDALIEDHLPDAFAIASVLAGPADVVDVGSGGGLPAVPLALLCPGLRLTLVEPLAKKAAFLRTAVRELGLGSRAQVEVRRAQELPAGSFDVAMSRATFAPAVWVRVAARLVRPTGRILVLTVPGVAVPGTRLSYFDGRRDLVQTTPQDCST